MDKIAAVEAAILEAEQIRARHDGIHSLHNCVCTLHLLHNLAQSGVWPPYAEVVFGDTMKRIRVIDQTGFDTATRDARLKPVKADTPSVEFSAN